MPSAAHTAVAIPSAAHTILDPTTLWFEHAIRRAGFAAGFSGDPDPFGPTQMSAAALRARATGHRDGDITRRLALWTPAFRSGWATLVGNPDDALPPTDVSDRAWRLGRAAAALWLSERCPRAIAPSASVFYQGQPHAVVGITDPAAPHDYLPPDASIPWIFAQRTAHLRVKLHPIDPEEAIKSPHPTLARPADVRMPVPSATADRLAAAEQCKAARPALPVILHGLARP